MRPTCRSDGRGSVSLSLDDMCGLSNRRSYAIDSDGVGSPAPFAEARSIADGSSWTYLYDVAGTEPWSVYERVWDVNGVLIVDRTTPDPPIV